MKHARVCLTAAFVVLAGVFPARAADFTVPPVPHRYVTDIPNALDDSTRTSVEDELRAYERQTGHQIIVWIGQTTGGVPLETWTAETAHQWRVGRKSYDDGAVLFLFMRDRRVRIEVGYGLESALTDAAAKHIIDEQIVPAMRAGNPNDAVANGVAAMLKTVTPDFTTTASVETPSQPAALPMWASWLLMALFFGVPIGFMALIISLRRRGGEASSGTSAGGWIGSSSSDSGSSSSDGFDSGGGDFGGGGASGSW